VVQQEAANQARAVIETKEINQEAMQYHDAISAAPMPSPAVVCVRYFTPPTVPKATPTASGTHGAVQVPAGDYRPVFDPAAGARIDQPAAKIGQRCDAQGNGLEAYIRDVVRPQ
jgi:hypothetical protein